MKYYRIKKRLIIVFAILFLVPALMTLSNPTAVRLRPAAKEVYTDAYNNNLSVRVMAKDPAIETLSADPENKYELKIRVMDNKGTAVPLADIQLAAYGPISDLGSFEPQTGTTDTNGNLTSFYIPPASLGLKAGEHADTPNGESNPDKDDTQVSVTVELQAKLVGTDESSTIGVKLMPVPIVLVHGYQAPTQIFSGLREYMSEQGYPAAAVDYNSETGIAPAAAELSKYLKISSSKLKKEGIQSKRFDIIAHSMGGLVARYYTCSSSYKSENNVRKLIFVSVPQKGSPFASLGLQYYRNASIGDMATDSALMTNIFPSMINLGLNPAIETGNILDRFDEVVGIQNASLAEWKINTEIFDVGESNLTVDKLMNGEILKATNHKRILYNRKVYQRIMEMLVKQMPYPILHSK